MLKMTSISQYYVLIFFILFIRLITSNEIFTSPTECPTFSTSEVLKGLQKTFNEEREIHVFCENLYGLKREKTELDGKTRTELDGGTGSSSCADIFHSGKTTSGIYTLNVKQKSGGTKQLRVHCDMKTDGGGWTIIQRRGDFGIPNENFYRNWVEYKNGFGDLTAEFWLGNEFIHLLTNQETVTLRIDLEDHGGHFRHQTYDHFLISDENTGYAVDLSYSSCGDLMDAMRNFIGAKFQTYDREDEHKCSTKYRGGWWYKNSGCYHANLNGIYSKGTSKSDWLGFNWGPWHGYNYSLKWGEMKIRPKSFETLILN